MTDNKKVTNLFNMADEILALLYYQNESDTLVQRHLKCEITVMMFVLSAEYLTQLWFVSVSVRITSKIKTTFDIWKQNEEKLTKIKPVDVQK